MCGIVGYVGQREVLPMLLQGLYKLEYRGYDSAGVALVQDGRLEVIKTQGRVATLEEKIIAHGNLKPSTGIGHTRWATHGEPSDLNAHPHMAQNGTVALVHNGIIENYLDLRKLLRESGYEIKTQTDTEVVAHLFEKVYEGDPVKALMDTVSHLRGSYALAVTSANAPNELVCTKKNNPLIIGLGDGENMIASDIPAILEMTRRYIVLLDGEVVRVTPEKVTVYNALGEEIEKEVMEVTWDVETAEKGGHEHFMIKEIMEQPRAVGDTVLPRIKNDLPDLDEYGLSSSVFKNIRNIHIVACGSALHTGLVGKVIIEKLARIPVICTVASEFRYSDPIIGPEDLCIVISQSGETADTLAALRESRQKGAKTVGIVNVVASTVAREVDQVLYTWAGPEIAVATTKAYSAQLGALYLIAVKAGLSRGTIDEQTAKAYCRDIAALPQLIEKCLETRSEMQYLSSLYSNRQHAFFLGRGIDFAAAQEASLKLKEISYVHSEAYAGGELKHGTISLIEPETLVVALCCDASVFEKSISNIKSVKARGAKVILLTNDKDFEADPEICDHLVRIPGCLPELSASLSIIPMQFLSYYVGVYRGCDIDKPRNLAKSVTVE